MKFFRKLVGIILSVVMLSQFSIVPIAAKLDWTNDIEFSAKISPKTVTPGEDITISFYVKDATNNSAVVMLDGGILGFQFAVDSEKFTFKSVSVGEQDFGRETFGKKTINGVTYYTNTIEPLLTSTYATDKTICTYVFTVNESVASGIYDIITATYDLYVGDGEGNESSGVYAFNADKVTVVSNDDYVTVNLYLKKDINAMQYSCCYLEYEEEKVQLVSGNAYGEWFSDRSGNVEWALDSRDKYMRANEIFLTLRFKVLSGNPKFYIKNSVIVDMDNNWEDIDTNLIGIEVVYEDSEFQVDIYRANYLLTFDIGSVMEKEYFNFDTPSKTIVDTGKNNGLSTMIDIWKLVTGVVDTVDDPTKLEDYVCEQKDVYESILLDLLESSVDSNVLAIMNNDVVKNSKKIADVVMSDIMNKYYYENVTDLTNICKLDDDVISAIKEIVTDCFEEEHSKINKISKISNVVGQTIEYATDLVDYCEKLMAFCNMLEMSESMQVIIWEMYKECPMDNLSLKSALLDLNYVLSAGEDDFINKMIGEFYGAAGLNVANYFFDKMWDSAKTKFMITNPEAYVLLAAYKTGKLMSNLAFNTDTIAEKYYKLAAVNEVENLLQNVYYRIKNIYLNNKNSKNAQNYNSMVGFMFKMLDADCEYSMKYLQETDSTLVAKIKNVFRDNDIDDAIEYVEQLQNRYGYYCEKVNTNWILSLPTNYPSVFVEYLSVLDDSLKKQKEYLVACPVDVYIYDEDGILVGSVIDDVPYCESDTELTIYVNGDKKTIYTYGEEYDIVYVGNDTGTMDITITEYDETKSAARSVSFNNVSLTDGATYTSSENGTTLTENAYELTTEMDERIGPDYDSLIAIESETHMVSITKGYFADSMDISRKLNYGQNVEIVAYIPEGYEFVNWSSDSGEDIFEDAGSITTRITVPDCDVNITANIIKCPTLSITEITSNKLTFKTINCENITEGNLILAVYNDDGSLNNVKTKEFAEEGAFDDLVLTNGKAKLMLWGKKNFLIPLTKPTEKIFCFETEESND